MPISRVIKAPTGFPVKSWATSIEEKAEQQLLNISKLPFIFKHVAVMPDCHYGKGATVGSVIASVGAVIPAAVGVDLGCGMLAVKTSLKASDLPESLDTIRHSIERSVPVGFSEHSSIAKTRLSGRTLFVPSKVSEEFRNAIEGHEKLEGAGEKAIRQIGSLGGGNHFIELCLDENNAVWIMLHSGSRNIGKVIADYFITKAKQKMEEFFITLPDADLAYFPDRTQEFKDYVKAVSWAQDYAMLNRIVMLELILDELSFYFPAMTLLESTINCHHNYISRENHYDTNVIVTRKGAIRARAGELGIIPGSMGTRSYIVRGRGSVESFHSSSHGAGRIMSRAKARASFTAADIEIQTKGVSCRKDMDIVDELPGAYKDIDEVMKNQEDLVEIVHTLKQVLCIKG